MPKPRVAQAKSSPEQSLAEKLHEAFCAGVDGLSAETGKTGKADKWKDVIPIRRRGYELMARALLLNPPQELIEAAAARNRGPVAPTGNLLTAGAEL